MSRSGQKKVADSVPYNKRQKTDSFSLTPSIVDILSHLDIGDLVRCKRVNQRMHDVIERNSHVVARPGIQMQFRLLTGLDPDGRKAEVILIAGFGSWLISDRRILMRTERNTKLIGEFIQLGGLICDEHKDYSDEPVLKRMKEGFFRKKKNNWLELPVDNIEEGVRLVLSHIFEKRYLDVLELRVGGWEEVADMDKWLVIIGNLVKEKRSRVVEIVSRSAYPGITALIQRLNVLEAYIKNVEELGEFLSSMGEWGRTDIRIELRETMETLQPVIDLIKKWQGGEMRVRLLQLGRPEQLNDLKWSRHEFVDCLREYEIHPFDVRFVEAEPKWRNVEVFLSRPTDDVVLCMSYSKRFHEFIMYDLVHNIATEGSHLAFQRSKVNISEDQYFRNG